MSLTPEEIQYQEANAQETAVPRLIAVFIICYVISYVSIILRFISRRLSNTQLRADDWLMLISTALIALSKDIGWGSLLEMNRPWLLSQIFTTAFLSLNIYLTQIGLGRHAILITNPKRFVICYTLLEVIYTITIFIIKLSTLYLWHRLFPVRRITTAIYIIGGILIAYSITQMVCVVTQCVPLSSLWDPSVPGTCIDLDTVFVVCSSLNILTDFSILILPIFQLVKLKVSARRKVQLVIMFCLGGFVLIISIIRIPQLTEISQSDQSWTLTDTAIWSSLECAVATLSACLPTMRPVFSRLVGHKPQNNRSAAYVHSKSNKPSWGGRSTKKPDSIVTDTQPFAKDQEDVYRSYIPLEEFIKDTKPEQQSPNGVDSIATPGEAEDARV